MKVTEIENIGWCISLSKVSILDAAGIDKNWEPKPEACWLRLHRIQSRRKNISKVFLKNVRFNRANGTT